MTTTIEPVGHEFGTLVNHRVPDSGSTIGMLVLFFVLVWLMARKSSRPNVRSQDGSNGVSGLHRVDVGSGTTLVAVLILLGTAAALILLSVNVIKLMAWCAVALVIVTAAGINLNTPPSRGRTHSETGSHHQRR